MFSKIGNCATSKGGITVGISFAQEWTSGSAGRNNNRFTAVNAEFVMRRSLTFIGSLFFLFTGIAQAATPDALDVLRQGTVEVGVMGGFWQATTVVGAAPTSNRSAAVVLPRLGVVATDPLGKSWWQGNLEILLEPIYMRFTKPSGADAAGAGVVLKYNFLSFGRWIPYWDAGAGMLWTNLAPAIPEQSTPFEFELETGPGVTYLVTERIAISTGVRYHHISNANIGERNTGLNAWLPYVGVSFFFSP